MNEETVVSAVEMGLLILQGLNELRQDLRDTQAGKTLAPLGPLPSDLKAAAAEFAQKHGLALPGAE